MISHRDHQVNVTASVDTSIITVSWNKNTEADTSIIMFTGYSYKLSQSIQQN